MLFGRVLQCFGGASFDVRVESRDRVSGTHSFRHPQAKNVGEIEMVRSPRVKIGDVAWMETLRDALTPECDGEVQAVGLL